MEFSTFISQLTASPMLAITAILTVGVIIVNGLTDAPNAIATCVSTRAIKPGSAIAMAAVFNFLGVLVMTLINSKVAMTVYGMVDFGADPGNAVIALCAALFSIVVWSMTAWRVGIPTSESHALIAGLSGSAIAIHGSLAGINWSEWVKVIYGLLLSTALGFVSGYVCAKGVAGVLRGADRRKTLPFFKTAQIFSGGFMAFMHGAQDGQKFMSVFLLGIFLVSGSNVEGEFNIPVWLMVLCSACMAFGTSVGGYRIIKSVGMSMVHLEPYQGFAADIGASICLLLSSLTGVPVSTTHTKTTAIMGVGASRRLSAVNWGVVKEMVLNWVLTFPGCGLVGFLMTKLFISIF